MAQKLFFLIADYKSFNKKIKKQKIISLRPFDCRALALLNG
ncbi:hypothetical protein NIASO_00005 [Niabella soli DSM 19437]|uniref:Uncharacterized protein n=1 Tax=Niabella soli DSM 19437 TaxID=929713 RepID=W0F1R2_9BACT|nr:hypothetical protein NIASO_00005 [Niabella soli DSM 19437]